MNFHAKSLGLFVLLSTAQTIWAADPQAENDFQQVNLCHELLDSRKVVQLTACPTGLCSSVYSLFDRGLKDESKGVAYLGVSLSQIGELLQHGRMRPGKYRWEIHLVSDKPAVRTWALETHYRLGRDEPRHKALYKHASLDASKREALELILSRAAMLSGQVALTNPVYLKGLSDLYDLFYDSHIACEIRIRFDDIMELIEDRKLPFKEPEYTDQWMPIEESLRLNKSHDYRMLVRYQKLMGMMNWLGLSTEEIGTPKSNSRQELEWLFSGLPKKDGYIVLLNSKVVPKLRHNRGASVSAESIDLDHILGIEPISDRAFRFLRALKP